MDDPFEKSIQIKTINSPIGLLRKSDTTTSTMKQLLIILITTIVFLLTLLLETTWAQVHYISKGQLKMGIQVTLDGRALSLDSLSDGFDPDTNIPQNLVIPEGSGIGIVPDSMAATDIALYVDSRDPVYISRPSRNNTRFNGFSMSSSPGTEHSYTFVDEDNYDTLHITWQVGYAPVMLADLFPADYFSNSVAMQFQYIFEDYPDSSQYKWSEVDYIRELNRRGLPVNPEFPYDENGLYFVVDELTDEARVQLKGFHESPQMHDPDDPYALFLYEDLAPGGYEFIVWPYEGAPENVTLRYPFTILRPWWQMPLPIAGFTLAGALVIGGGLFAMYRSRQQRKTRELQWTQQLTQAELKAIRAQLNPHFLFNALNSIQNLVSQEKNEAANSYIRKLSRLLRQVLSASEKQFQELEQELELTRLYIGLEQLRYAFSADIRVNEDVSGSTLVPVMLLQPYVENAVKHGMARMGEKGKITILVSRKAGSIVIEILDNGPGLSEPTADSAGLHLGNERIRNLNTLYSGEATVTITNREEQSGVRVCITLPEE